MLLTKVVLRVYKKIKKNIVHPCRKCYSIHNTTRRLVYIDISHSTVQSHPALLVTTSALYKSRIILHCIVPWTQPSVAWKMDTVIRLSVQSDNDVVFSVQAEFCRYRRLRSTGQRLGAAGTLIHLQRHLSETHMNQFTMNVANVGDVEAVLCRHGEPLLLTKKFVTTADRDECQRVCAADGIITEVSTCCLSIKWFNIFRRRFRAMSCDGQYNWPLFRKCRLHPTRHVVSIFS